MQKQSVDLVIRDVNFKGFHKVSYLHRHKGLAGQRCPFLNQIQINQTGE